MVTVCAGHRCRALWQLLDESSSDPDDVMPQRTSDQLKHAIRDTPGGVLVRSQCLGMCHEGAVIAVAYRQAGTMRGLCGHAFSSATRATVLRDLLSWIPEITSPAECREVPRTLRSVVIRPHGRR